MDNSNISWTDGTWNPWMGCDKVSVECKNCYIGRILEKQGRPAWGKLYRAKTTWGFPVRMQKQSARFIAEHGRHYRMFTCSLSDFFHNKADEWRPRAWEIIRQCPDVDFLVLTKRPERIVERLPSNWGEGYPNVWLGVSIGVMKSAGRADELRTIPAAVRFISAEPLLESLAGLNLDGIHWLIAGGESGENYRYMDTDWAEELRQKCQAASVAFFFKQGSGFQHGMHENALGALYHNWPIQIKPAKVEPEPAEALAPAPSNGNESKPDGMRDPALIAMPGRPKEYEAEEALLMGLTELAAEAEEEAA